MVSLDRPRAASISERDADALLARGNAAIRQGRVDVALDCFGAAAARQPDRFEALANLGSALLVAGRCAAAETHLRRALSLRPRELPLHLALARACAAQGRLAEGEEACRQALALDLANIDALVALGTLLRLRGRYGEAGDCYARALALQPQCAPAHYGVGVCRRERGDVAAAAASFERAIAAQPDYVDAHYRLAVLRPNDPPGARLAQLEALHARVAGLALPQRIRYWFALGRLRESAGAFDAAFAAYAEGNRLQWRKLGTGAQHAAREALDAAFVKRIRAAFGRTLLAAAPCAPAPDADALGANAPIFIVGMPRSGTSLVEQMLAAHPRVRAGGELRVLPELLEETFGFAESPAGDAYPEIAARLPSARLRELGAVYAERARGRVGGAAGRITDKLPGNFLHVGMLHLMLPRARIVHVQRDPRDACVSCFANLFARDNLAFSYELGALGRHCRHREALMRHWRAALPAGVLKVVRYEDLVAAPGPTLRGLLDFLGLPWDARCLDFHLQRRAVHTVSAGQVQRPMYASSIGRWRSFARHLAPLLEALGDAAAGGD